MRLSLLLERSQSGCFMLTCYVIIQVCEEWQQMCIPRGQSPT